MSIPSVYRRALVLGLLVGLDAASGATITSEVFCSIELATGGLQQATDPAACRLGVSPQNGAGGPFSRASVSVSAGLAGFGSNFAMITTTEHSAVSAMPPGVFDPAAELTAIAAYNASVLALLTTPGPVRQGFLVVEILSSFTSFAPEGGREFNVAGRSYVDLPDLKPLQVMEETPITLGELFEFSASMSGGGSASVLSGARLGDSFSSVFLTAYELDGTPVQLSEVFVPPPGAGAGAGDPGPPVTSVPEPGSASLTVVAAGAMLLWRRLRSCPGR